MRHAIGMRHEPAFVDAQAEGGTGAHGNQQVHVAGAGTQRLPATPIETGPQPELHGRGQQELRPRGQHPFHAKGHPQHRQHEWRGEHQGKHDTRTLVECRQRTPARRPRASGGIGTSCRNGMRKIDTLMQRIAGTRPCGKQRLAQRIEFVGTRHDFDPRRIRGQVDRDLEHTGNGCQRLLDTRHAGSAIHAFHAEIEFLARHGVACPLHRGDDRPQRGGSVGKRHRGRFTGQVDRCIQHAGGCLERFLDARHAGSAGHADDRPAVFPAGVPRFCAALLRRCNRCGVHGAEYTGPSQRFPAIDRRAVTGRLRKRGATSGCVR